MGLLLRDSLYEANTLQTMLANYHPRTQKRVVCVRTYLVCGGLASETIIILLPTQSIDLHVYYIHVHETRCIVFTVGVQGRYRVADVPAWGGRGLAEGGGGGTGRGEESDV